MNKSALAIAIAMTAATSANAAPTMEEMWQIIQQQQAEIERLKGQQSKTQEKLQETEVKVEATADAVDQVSTGPVAKMAEWANNTQVGGYGEHHFNRFDDADDQVDAHRFVLFVNHQFSDTVRLFTELELEHSLAGEGKPGEVELEQAYIEWDFAKNHRLNAGLFLIPVGILNETHEPDTFYGTERNNVEKNIIPTTWWETGVQVVGEIAPGLSYNAGVHSGLQMTADQGVRKGRQKSANAKAEDLAFTTRLKYTGVAGLELAGTIQYQQDVTQGNDPATADDAEAMLFETHAVYQSGDFGLRVLYAMWDIDNDAFEANGTDEQEGWYIEPSYKVTEKLGVFVRYSEWDNKAGNSADTEIESWDYGINYWLTPRVVFKADFTDQSGTAVGSKGDSFNLGVGWSF